MGPLNPENPSKEAIRGWLNKVDKLKTAVAMLGKRFAIQTEREIGRFQTYYPGQRTELDYTKFGRYLFPTEHWNEPQLYFTGFGIDHYSTVCKGFTTTTAPSARDAIRLYRNCVLPKCLWLPEPLNKMYANEWDVFGLEESIAIDNGMDLIADAAVLVFIMFGATLLRMPPKRGDLKGRVERFIGVVEQQFVSKLSGYVARKFVGLDERHTNVRGKAKLKADSTVAAHNAELLPYLMEYHRQPHPDLGKPRIQVWRDGQINAPLLLPTGMLQIRSTFALTYSATLTREGVRVMNRQYNSTDLHNKYRIFSGKVIVKADPDDIRSVLVLFPDENQHVEASMTNFDLDYPISVELYDLVMKRLANSGIDSLSEDLSDKFSVEVNQLQTKPESPTVGAKHSSNVGAATHAAALPLIGEPKPKPESSAGFDFEALLGASRLGRKRDE